MAEKRKSRISNLIVIGLLLYFAIAFINQQKLFDEKNKEIRITQQKIDEELEINKKLTEDLEIMGSDEYIEQVAREKLGMIEKDERKFVDVND